MKKQAIICRTGELKARALFIIGALPVEPVFEVIIREYKKDISAEQRGLYFRWMGIMGNEIGLTKNDMHLQCKEDHLVPIFTRDDQDYAEMVAAVRATGRANMWKKIIKLTSITDANTAQMSEYMNEISREAAGLDIRLPHPDDRGR